ncbi:hypothetical protein [Bradyrhizobium lupini]|uniref:hypothetical protein n=1 Tax=Rhizobium lupini TaxID=136996 RepID=UPI0034C63E81
MAKVFTHKLGKTRAGEGTRIWLEGKRLLDHGFTHRATCQRKWSEGKLIVVLVDAAAFEQLPRNERTTVAGSAERPIIDIVGEAVRNAFPSGTVEATWSQGRIVIKGA